jgi:hypothetical protein
VLTPDGPAYVIAANLFVRQLVRDHLEAVTAHPQTGIPELLTHYIGLGISRADGKQLEFVSDVGTIDRMAKDNSFTCCERPKARALHIWLDDSVAR